MTKVLYVEGNIDGTVGGSYFLLLDLVRSLDRSRFRPVVVFHRSNYLEDAFRQCGAEVHVIPRQTPFSFGPRWADRLFWPVKALVNVYRGLAKPTMAYRSFLRSHRFDLVNLNNSITRNHPWMLASIMTKTPCITHEMGINTHYSGMSKFLGRRLGAVICLSHAIRDAMIACGVNVDNACVIHCGIDLSRYREIESPSELRRKHSIPDTAAIIGVVGNIRSWKGQETIVRATAQLKRKYPDIRCLLVGGATDSDPTYLRFLQDLCSNLRLEDNVLFTGFQRNAIDYMRLMDVVCHTSTSPEPFGIVTLEAMSLGKPLISTTHGGPAEVVVNGTTGLLVEAGAPDALADAIDSFLTDRDRAQEMGRRGYQRLLEDFSLVKNVEQTTLVYDRVLRRGNREAE